MKYWSPFFPKKFFLFFWIVGSCLGEVDNLHARSRKQILTRKKKIRGKKKQKQKRVAEKKKSKRALHGTILFVGVVFLGLCGYALYKASSHHRRDKEVLARSLIEEAQERLDALKKNKPFFFKNYRGDPHDISGQFNSLVKAIEKGPDQYQINREALVFSLSDSDVDDPLPLNKVLLVHEVIEEATALLPALISVLLSYLPSDFRHSIVTVTNGHSGMSRDGNYTFQAEPFFSYSTKSNLNVTIHPSPFVKPNARLPYTIPADGKKLSVHYTYDGAETNKFHLSNDGRFFIWISSYLEEGSSLHPSYTLNVFDVQADKFVLMAACDYATYKEDANLLLLQEDGSIFIFDLEERKKRCLYNFFAPFRPRASKPILTLSRKKVYTFHEDGQHGSVNSWVLGDNPGEIVQQTPVPIPLEWLKPFGLSENDKITLRLSPHGDAFLFQRSNQSFDAYLGYSLNEAGQYENFFRWVFTQTTIGDRRKLVKVELLAVDATNYLVFAMRDFHFSEAIPSSSEAMATFQQKIDKALRDDQAPAGRMVAYNHTHQLFYFKNEAEARKKLQVMDRNGHTTSLAGWAPRGDVTEVIPSPLFSHAYFACQVIHTPPTQSDQVEDAPASHPTAEFLFFDRKKFELMGKIPSRVDKSVNNFEPRFEIAISKNEQYIALLEFLGLRYGNLHAWLVNDMWLSIYNLSHAKEKTWESVTSYDYSAIKDILAKENSKSYYYRTSSLHSPLKDVFSLKLFEYSERKGHTIYFH